MKKSLLLVFVLSIFFGCTSTNTNSSYSSYEIISERDDFKGITFYQHEYLKKFSTVPMYIYAGKYDNSEEIYLRIVFKYKGSNWIHMKNATIINLTGDKQIFEFGLFGTESKVYSYDNLVEYADLNLTKEKALFFYNLISKEGVKVRLAGKYYKDYEIKEKSTLYLKEMIEFAYPDFKDIY